MKDIQVFGFVLSAWIVLPVVYFLWVTALLVVKRIVFFVGRRLVERTRTQLDNMLLAAADFPLTLIILASGALVVEKIFPSAREAQLTQQFLVLFRIISIVAVVMFVDRVTTSLLKHYAPRVEVLRSTGGVVQGFIRAAVVGLGILVLLDSMGVSITPLLASLGVGSLAIALALQPTLENLFAGFQIIVDKPVRVGQFVKLESGEEGYIHKIGWRSTWVRMLPNNVVVIPNKVLVNSRIVNYYYPSREMAVLVQVGVHYESDLEKVERVTIEVGKETLKEVTGGVEDFEPFIRYHTFGDFSINFTVILRAKEFVDNYLVKHEFIKRLHKRYAEEGINIPYPIRAVNFDQEKAFSDQRMNVTLNKD